MSDTIVEIFPFLSCRKHALWGPDTNWATPGENVGTCVEITTKGRRSEDGKTEIPPQTLKERKFTSNLIVGPVRTKNSNRMMSHVKTKRQNELFLRFCKLLIPEFP